MAALDMINDENWQDAVIHIKLFPSEKSIAVLWKEFQSEKLREIESEKEKIMLKNALLDMTQENSIPVQILKDLYGRFLWLSANHNERNNVSDVVSVEMSMTTVTALKEYLDKGHIVPLVKEFFDTVGSLGNLKTEEYYERWLISNIDEDTIRREIIEKYAPTQDDYVKIKTKIVKRNIPLTIIAVSPQHAAFFDRSMLKIILESVDLLKIASWIVPILNMIRTNKAKTVIMSKTNFGDFAGNIMSDVSHAGILMVMPSDTDFDKRRQFVNQIRKKGLNPWIPAPVQSNEGLKPFAEEEFQKIDVPLGDGTKCIATLYTSMNDGLLYYTTDHHIDDYELFELRLGQALALRLQSNGYPDGISVAEKDFWAIVCVDRNDSASLIQKLRRESPLINTIISQWNTSEEFKKNMAAIVSRYADEKAAWMRRSDIIEIPSAEMVFSAS
jgi:hypothetical protein